MAIYRLTATSAILVNATGAVIPADPNNLAYQAYLTWVGLGNTPDAANYPVPSGSGNIVLTTGATITNPVINNENSGPLAGFRNRLLNGTMATDQRNGGAAQKLAGGLAAYTVDRWLAQVTGTTSTSTTAASGTGSVATISFASQTNAPVVGSSITVSGVTPAGYNGTYTVTASTATSVSYASATTGAQTVAGSIQLPAIAIGQQVTGSGQSRYRYQITGNAGVSAVTFSQRIEQINCYDLSNQSITFSVDLSNSVLTTVNWVVSYPTAADNYTGTTTIASGSFIVSSTLARYSATVSIPNITVNGLQVTFSVGAQTSGTWVIGSAQFEVGTVATPMEIRGITTETNLCQRYYQMSYPPGSAPGAATTIGLVGCVASGAGEMTYGVQFAEIMRVTPTVSTWDGAGNAGKYSGYNSSTWMHNIGNVSIITTGPESFLIDTAAGGGGVLIQYTASAEL
jgi:hypothetical protein